MSSFIKKFTPFFRKPSLTHADSQIRLEALNNLDLTLANDQQNLLTWVAAEAEPAVLEAGLVLLAKTSQQEEQLAKLALTDQQLSLSLIKIAPTSHLAIKCLEQLEADEATWLDLAIHSKTTQLRQAAAEKLTSEAAFVELLASVNNDKGLQRYARQKLEAIKAQQAAELAQQEALAEVLTQLKDLTQAQDKQLFSAKLQHLMHKWQEVATAATQADLANYEELIKLAKQQEADVLAEEAKLKQLEEEQQRQAEEATKQAILAEEKRLAAAAKKAEQLAEQKQQQQAAKEKAKQAKAKQQKMKAAAKQLIKDIKQLEQLVNQGEIQAATRLNQKINQELTHQPLAAEVGNKQQQKYRQLTAKLHELNSWQGFAAAPKRQELVEQMQALAADLTMQPQIKADKIQQLQQQWRELGSAAANKEIWLEFKQAADTAYEPCKLWFEEQNQLKVYNQEQRQIICAELEKLAANSGHLELNEAALDKLLQEVHNEWHRFSPIGRAEGKKLAKKFQQAIQPLKDQLYGLRQVNIDAKRDLIAKAEALLTEDNLNQAIETNKQLQEDWRTLGRAPGSLEPRLWKEFRAACDALFNKRAEANLAKVEASEATYQQALAELSQAEQQLNTNNIKAAQQHLAASHSQGLTQKHLRLLANRQQEIKAAINQQQQEAAIASQAKKLHELLASFSPHNEQPTEALKQLIYLEILTEQPSAPENQQLRLELQIDLMNQGKTSLNTKEKYQQLVKGLEKLNRLGLGQQSEVYKQLKKLVMNFLG